MDKFRIKKEQSRNFSSSKEQKAFVGETSETKELLQKEIDLNLIQQNVLQKKMATSLTLLNDLPSSDPQYSFLRIQSQMDQIELDELKIRESILKARLESL